MVEHGCKGLYQGNTIDLFNLDNIYSPFLNKRPVNISLEINKETKLTIQNVFFMDLTYFMSAYNLKRKK